MLELKQQPLQQNQTGNAYKLPTQIKKHQHQDILISNSHSPANRIFTSHNHNPQRVDDNTHKPQNPSNHYNPQTSQSLHWILIHKKHIM